MRTVVSSLVLFLAVGCATTQPEVRQEETQVAPAPAPAPAVKAAPPTPKQYASAFPRPTECEPAARKLQEKNADYAWAVLKACVDHGNFTSLGMLTSGAWDKDLQTRPDAAALLAKVVAGRGGDVEGDLAALRAHRVPLFTLGAAMAQPDTYKGRLVLVRAKVNESKAAAGKPTLAMSEVGLGATSHDVEVGTASVSSYNSSGSYRASAKTTRYGSGSAKLDSNYSSSSRYSRTRKVHENEVQETGREVLARLSQPDPFLEVGKEFVFLARFDGVRTTSKSTETEEEEAETTAIISIVGYFEPSALVLE